MEMVCVGVRGLDPLSNPIDPLQNSADTSLTVFGMRLRSARGLRAGRPPCSQADERARAAIDQAQGDVGEAMGVPRKHVNELCNGRRAVTAPTALIVARVFGNTPDFWLNVQRR